MQNMSVVRIDEGHMRVVIKTSKTSGNPIFAIFASDQYNEPGAYIPIREEAGQLAPVFAIEIERKEQAQAMLHHLNRILDKYF